MSLETASTLNNNPFPTQHTNTTNTNTASAGATHTNTAAASTQTDSSSSTDSKHVSKLILKSALQKANVAVQCDSTNNVVGAIEAYREAISLLNRVLLTVEKENDRQRLQSIHDSYSERIRLLSSITEPRQESSTIAPTEASANYSYTMKQPSTATNTTTTRPSHTMMLRKMTSFNSIDGSVHEKLTSPVRNNWYEHAASPSTRLVSQKEMTKSPVSPPIIQMQASKSTPTHPHHRHGRKASFREINDYSDSDDFDLEKDELHLLGRHEPIARPTHHFNSTMAGSNRSSMSSVDSILSSEDSIVEQPAMALPSLKKRDEDTTPIPKARSAFRTRTSSLPKPPLMQRSSSMSTVDTLASPTDEQKEIIMSEAMPIPQSQQYPPHMIINRPIISRPSVGGLGSMRKKAANRLSMDGFTVNRAKEKLSNSPSTVSTYGLFLKDHIQPASASDLDYIVEGSPALDETSRSSSIGGESPFDEKRGTTPGSNHLRLLLALEKSMLEGAHITQKLYIPKNLWHQPNIRLPSMDIKVSACESLLSDIVRLENWSYLDDLVSSTRLLDHFETSVDHLQMTLSKKLKRDSTIESSTGTSASQSSHSASTHASSRDSISMSRMDSGKKTQSFMSWGTKLTKSVERMNAFSLTKTEDQYKNYIEVLQRLFAKIHVLEFWINHYTVEKKKSSQPQHDILISKLIKICGVISNVIGGFVVRDITVLLSKWLKRGSSWVNE